MTSKVKQNKVITSLEMQRGEKIMKKVIRSVMTETRFNFPYDEQWIELVLKRCAENVPPTAMLRYSCHHLASDRSGQGWPNLFYRTAILALSLGASVHDETCSFLHILVQSRKHYMYDARYSRIDMDFWKEEGRLYYIKMLIKELLLKGADPSKKTTITTFTQFYNDCEKKDNSAMLGIIANGKTVLELAKEHPFAKSSYLFFIQRVIAHLQAAP